MAKLELSRDLSLSPEDAWEHVSDLSTLGDWLSMHEGWRGELPSELEVGTTIVGVAARRGCATASSGPSVSSIRRD